MKNVIAVGALSLVLTSPWHCSSASPQEQKQAVAKADTNRPQDNREWRPATYLGLTIGKSHRIDVVRILGEPKRVDRPPDQNLKDEDIELWYVYESRGEFAGSLTVVMDERTDVVLRIDLVPDNLSQADAVKYFGSDFILTRYAFDECMGDEESAPLYETPTGPLLEVEYRHRGIAIAVTESGKVNSIHFLNKPIGSPQSKCKSSTAQLPR
jgi:hypothetical protein